MKKADFTDHEMAAWLRKFGKWTHVSPEDSSKVEFYSESGDLIALGLYDNSQATREFYIGEG